MEKDSRLKKFIVGYLNKQYFDILVGKRKRFNVTEVTYSAKKIFYKGSVLDDQYFLAKVGKIFSNEKKKIQQKARRFETNSKLLKLQESYPNSNPILMAKILAFRDNFDLRSSKDILMLEDIIRIATGKKLHYNFE